jgi:zinc protease
MKKTFLIGIFTLFIMISTGYPNKVRAVDQLKYPELPLFSIPEIQKAELNNGIHLRFLSGKQLPLIHMICLFKGGSLFDPPQKTGLSDLTAELLRIGGTKDLSGQQIDELLDKHGINIDIDADTDYFVVRISCLLDKFDLAINTFSSMLQNPEFDSAKIVEVKRKMAALIARRNDDPNKIPRREFLRLIYGANSPLAAVTEYDHLNAITRQDLLTIRQKFICPDNMLVGISGPVSFAEVKSIFSEHFEGWQEKSRIPEMPVVSFNTPDFKIAFTKQEHLNQSFIIIGHAGVMETIEQEPVIRVLNSIFSDGLKSRLVNRIRTEMGLTYTLYGGIYSKTFYPGIAYYYTFTKSESTMKAVRAIFEEISQIRRELVTDKELKDAKDYFFNSFVFKYSSPEKIVANELIREFYGRSADYTAIINNKIRLVTKEQVLKAAQNYLQPDKMIIYIVGNKEKLDEQPENFGHVKMIDLSIKPPATDS